MRNFEIRLNLEKKLIKISKKDKPTYERIMKKIEEILSCEDINTYKNLRNDLKNFKRVHIGHFVLIFSFNISKNVVFFEDFDHHDNIYN